MKQIRAQVSLVAKVDVPVLLLGESGVGKEILARLIHKMSIRAHRPLLKVNCAALPAELLESELFGYDAGAFTGAQRSKPGKFEQCNKGTILLDEIGEMSTPLQAKLLHVLQDGSFSRLGSRSNVTVDVRVLAATNINIEEAIANRVGAAKLLRDFPTAYRRVGRAAAAESRRCGAGAAPGMVGARPAGPGAHTLLSPARAPAGAGAHRRRTPPRGGLPGRARRRRGLCRGSAERHLSAAALPAEPTRA